MLLTLPQSRHNRSTLLTDATARRRDASQAMTVRRVRVVAVLGALWAGAATAVPVPGAAPLPADCALAWQVELLPDTQPRVLRVTLSFDAGGRARSTLRLPAGWAAIDEGAENPAAPQLQAVPDEPMLRRVAHGPTGRVQLRWRTTSQKISRDSSCMGSVISSELLIASNE